ncbi:MAG: flagellar basal body-associated FliL family protein [Burkholderiaceae bacterium]
MSAAAAAAAPSAETGVSAPAGSKKKKLIIVAAIALVLVLALGAGAVVLLKMKAARAAASLDDPATASAVGDSHSTRPDPDHPPTFLALDPFVVNLADRETDRYAQIGLTFEVVDAKFAEKLKAYMPAIRNTVLLILAQKTSTDLMDRPGKEQLAAQIQREAARTMGIMVAEPAAQRSVDAARSDPSGTAAPKAARKSATVPNPIRHVHFSSFIIQ